MKLAHNAKIANRLAEEAAEKVKKLKAQVQKLDDEEKADNAAAEKTVFSRTQEKLCLQTRSHSQNTQSLPSQQIQQGHLS